MGVITHLIICIDVEYCLPTCILTIYALCAPVEIVESIIRIQTHVAPIIIPPHYYIDHVTLVAETRVIWKIQYLHTQYAAGVEGIYLWRRCRKPVDK